MRVLCYGGAFNPIHHGHLICARAVAESAGFDRVCLIPSAVPPHKMGDPMMASAKDRLTMCQLPVAGLTQFDVSNIEFMLNEPSYTLKTAEALLAKGWREVHWLIGADTLPRLPTWHQPEQLLQKVQFTVMARPGSPIDWESLPSMLQPLRHRVVPAPLIDISSTGIRQRVAAGNPIDFLVPAGVAKYIESHRLYRQTNPTSP